MLATRLIYGGLRVSSALRCSYTRVAPTARGSIPLRQFSHDPKQNRTWESRRSFRGIDTDPGETSSRIGRAVVAGGALCGIGALCYYGTGLSKAPGIAEQSMLWPKYVRDRVRATYTYLGGSLVFTAGSAFAVYSSPAALSLVSRGGFAAFAASLAALIVTGEFCRRIPYRPGFGTKQMAWVLHTSALGAVIAPLCLLGGPVLVRAAWYTAGVVGGLSAVAACAPSEKFLSMGGPLAIGLGAVVGASIGSCILGPASAVGAGLHSISLYGGLLVFSGLLLYDTQAAVRAAETYPQYAEPPFDPINASTEIYLDVINIFIRIAIMLADSERRK